MITKDNNNKIEILSVMHLLHLPEKMKGKSEANIKRICFYNQSVEDYSELLSKKEFFMNNF